MRSVLTLAMIVLAASASGCETTPRTDDRRAALGTASDARGGGSVREIEQEFVEGLSRRPTMSSHVRAALRPLKTIAYDDMVLPLVSPDGRYLAVQTGVSPTWPTLLAEIDADPPVVTGIDIYRLDVDGRSLEYLSSVNYPAVLGRSLDREGFLIEAPQEDGARWIGKVNWRTGAIDWLVADEKVNAFGALGVGGRLAWSRRGVDAPEDHFELVVRYGADERVVSDESRSWLMPTWSNRREHSLYVFAIDEDHDLELVFADARDGAAFRQSQRRLPLARHADVYNAYQSIGAQVCGPDRLQPQQEQFVFYHPSQMRMAIWRPLSTRGTNLVLLDRQSYAAVVEPEGFALVSSETGLLLQGLDRPETQRREVLPGLQVVRQIASEEWPYILLVPEEGHIALALLSLLPAE